MGEIADVIRRARSRAVVSGDDRELPGALRSALVPGAAPLRASQSPAQDGRWLETAEPGSRAIVLRDGPEAEACRHIALRLRSRLEARHARSVAVVSALREEGKTTVLCDLGIALASISRGRGLALVDLDLRNPSLARYLSLPRDVGVEQVLLGTATLDEVRVALRQPALDVYPAVAPQRAAHELFVLPRFAEMLAELERRYELVLIDTPPSLILPDSKLILQHTAMCLPVARAGRTRARHFRELVELLPRAQIVGQLLNGVRVSRLDAYRYEAYGDEVETPRARRRKQRKGGKDPDEGEQA